MRIKSILAIPMLGGILLLLGIITGLTDFNFFGVPFVRLDLVPIALAFLGGLLLVTGVVAIITEKYKPQTLKTVENDERYVAIVQKAQSKTFSFMVVVFSLSLLFLTMLGYMNLVFLVLQVFF